MTAGARNRLEWSRLGLKELYESFEFIAAEDIYAANLFATGLPLRLRYSNPIR